MEDPIEALMEAEPGTVIYGFSEGTETEPSHMEFLIRENSAPITRIAEEVEIRSGIVESAGLPVPIVLFRFPPLETVYRSFWNYHHPDTDPVDGNIFQYMAGGQNEILIKFIGDSGRVEKLIVLRHPLAGFFQKAIRQCENMQPWPIDSFFDALDEIDSNQAGSAGMWDSFGGN